MCHPVRMAVAQADELSVRKCVCVCCVGVSVCFNHHRTINICCVRKNYTQLFAERLYAFQTYRRRRRFMYTQMYAQTRWLSGARRRSFRTRALCEICAKALTHREPRDNDIIGGRSASASGLWGDWRRVGAQFDCVASACDA